MPAPLVLSDLVFTKELNSSCFDEAKPLLEKHYQEIAHFKDIPLDPDWPAYIEMLKVGALRCYSARNSEGQLVGYAVFVVRRALHYVTSIQAFQDILFILPEYRGRGKKFILWCDEQLKSEGVQLVYHHIKAEHNFGPMMKRIGYSLVDLIYYRRLDT